MQRVGFILKVKPDRMDEYKARHAAVWPEMREALTRQGWHNYSLFLRDDGTLFGYVEVADNLAASLKGMEGEPINAKWQASMADLVDVVPGLRVDQALATLEEVFHLD